MEQKESAESVHHRREGAESRQQRTKSMKKSLEEESAFAALNIIPVTAVTKEKMDRMSSPGTEQRHLPKKFVEDYRMEDVRSVIDKASVFDVPLVESPATFDAPSLCVVPGKGEVTKISREEDTVEMPSVDLSQTNETGEVILRKIVEKIPVALESPVVTKTPAIPVSEDVDEEMDVGPVVPWHVSAEELSPDQRQQNSSLKDQHVVTLLEDTSEGDHYWDKDLLEYSDDRDPRKRHVVRFKYVGDEESIDMGKRSRSYIVSTILIETMGFPLDDVLAVIQFPGSKETDVCLVSERACQRFWADCRLTKKLHRKVFEGFEIFPLFRDNIKVLTITFQTTTIPAENVAYWVSQYADILMGPDLKWDKGMWTGRYRCVIALRTDPMTSQVVHLPKVFFLGMDKGIARYSGQPQACIRCGSYEHVKYGCKTALCLKCGSCGHAATACHSGIQCNLCDGVGHTYFLCPQSYSNKRDVKEGGQVEQQAQKGKEHTAKSKGVKEAKENLNFLLDQIKKRKFEVEGLQQEIDQTKKQIRVYQEKDEDQAVIAPVMQELKRICEQFRSSRLELDVATEKCKYESEKCTKRKDSTGHVSLIRVKKV